MPTTARVPIDPGEAENITFDFGPAMSPGVYITNVNSITCSAVVNAAADPDPQSRVLSAGMLMPSAETGAADAAMRALFGNMIAGVVYQLQCIVSCIDSQRLPIRWHIRCAEPPGT